MRKHIATIHEPTTDVIACTLDASAAQDQVDEWKRLRDSHLKAIEDVPSGVRMRLDGRAAEAATDLAAREAACCGFLRIAVVEDGDDVLVEITGDDDARPVIAALAGAG